MRNKYTTLLVAFVVAIGLWLYVVTAVSPEHEQNYYGIPVVLENEDALLDRDLMILSGQNASVSVRLYGNRSDLQKLNAANLTATVDLNGINEPGTYSRDYRISFPPGVSNVSISQRITASVTLEVVEYAIKEVPVRLVLQGEAQEDKIIDEDQATFSVDTVTVSGPKAEIDQISFAGLEVDRTGLETSIAGDYVYTLMNADKEPVDAANVQTDTGPIHLTLPVEYIKEVKLVVGLVDGGGATSDDAQWKVEPDTIRVSGSREALNKISDTWVLTDVDLGTVDSQSGFQKDVEIKLPENVTNRSNMASVQVTVTVQNLATKTMTLTRDHIEILNLPEGMDVDIFTQQMDVIIRGKAEELEGITLDSLTAAVDLTGYSFGNHALPLTFTLKDAGQAGVFGRYTVTAGITESAPAETEG